jgi:uncharacterized protein (TIGR01244 family)
MPSLKWTFIVALLVGAGCVLLPAAISRYGHRSFEAPARELADSVWVTEQISPEQLAGIKARGFRAVLDLRPDGEVPEQPSSATMAAAAQAEGLAFDYIPVPHGEIPPAAVEALGRSLAQDGRPLLLYCRSGRRAARGWALAEASRAGGLSAAAIAAAVRAAGQDVDDLGGQMDARIAARPAGH